MNHPVSSDRLSDMLISTTSELETQLISISISKNGQAERMIEEVQMIINDFRAKFLSSLITVIQHLQDTNSKDKNFDNFRKNLESSVMKYKQKNLMFQMKALVNCKIKALIETLHFEHNQQKKHFIISQLQLLNESLSKIENTLNNNNSCLQEQDHNSFEKRNSYFMNENVITPLPQRQMSNNTHINSAMTPLLSESEENIKKQHFITPINHPQPAFNSSGAHLGNNGNISSISDHLVNQHSENHKLNSFNKITIDKNSQNMVQQYDFSLYKMFDACLNSICKDQMSQVSQLQNKTSQDMINLINIKQQYSNIVSQKNNDNSPLSKSPILTDHFHSVRETIEEQKESNSFFDPTVYESENSQEKLNQKILECDHQEEQQYNYRTQSPSEKNSFRHSRNSLKNSLSHSQIKDQIPNIDQNSQNGKYSDYNEKELENQIQSESLVEESQLLDFKEDDIDKINGITQNKLNLLQNQKIDEQQSIKKEFCPFSNSMIKNFNLEIHSDDNNSEVFQKQMQDRFDKTIYTHSIHKIIRCAYKNQLRLCFKAIQDYKPVAIFSGSCKNSDQPNSVMTFGHGQGIFQLNTQNQNRDSFDNLLNSQLSFNFKEEQNELQQQNQDFEDIIPAAYSNEITERSQKNEQTTILNTDQNDQLHKDHIQQTSKLEKSKQKKQIPQYSQPIRHSVVINSNQKQTQKKTSTTRNPKKSKEHLMQSQVYYNKENQKENKGEQKKVKPEKSDKKFEGKKINNFLEFGPKKDLREEFN